MIKLLFSATNSIFSRAVRFATWSGFSHVDFIVPDGQGFLINEWGYPTTIPKGSVLGSTVTKGVRSCSIKDVVENCTKYAIAEIDAPDVAIEYALSQYGKKYDYMAILGYPARANIESQNRWFCSELVYWALARSGVELYNEDVKFVTPRDIYIHPFCNVLEVNNVGFKRPNQIFGG